MLPFKRVLVLVAYWLLTVASLRGQSTPSQQPSRVSKLPADAVLAAKSLVLAEGLKAELFAAEPLLANPVAFCIDEKGRLFICETFRIARGAEDNRDHEAWIDDDLASQTVDDRLALYKKHLGDDLEQLQDHQDRVRRIEDVDGDGVADRSRVFADGFRGILEGVGAGVLAHGGNVYYACIPRLWLLRDDDDDGRADEREVLHEGYGVRVALLGHDLHGLCLGPDGRLYFSVGDRGYHVRSKVDDRAVADAESGAIFRCEMDGTNLEVFATGLRNPQDLEFDNYGNLFTADNNSDSGDLARWVHLLEGGDSGWRMAYQYLPDRGPWNRERLWEPFHPDQPAYIVPPLANLGDGPAGIAYYPGTGLPDAYRENFFVCDFRADPALSGVRTFKLKPKGASFELIDSELFIWNCVPTDIQFSPDGCVYVTDWVRGWKGTGKGRVFRVYDPQARQAEPVAEVCERLANGVREAVPETLSRLLTHPDRRIRREAQFRLVENDDVTTLATVAHTAEKQLARLHAIWGLGQIARAGRDASSRAVREVRALIQDADEEVRVAAATIVGDLVDEASADRLTSLLDDSHPRSRYAAAVALGKIGPESALDAIVEMIRRNNDEDPTLRHAGILGLAGCADQETLAAMAEHPDRSVRLAAVVALRRQRSSRVAKFLGDPDPAIGTEAARAIYDVPIAPALPQLAAMIQGELDGDPLIRRVVAANFHLGSAETAEALASFAADPSRPVHSRLQTLNLLGQWGSPPGRDPVLGLWRPPGGARDASVVPDAVRPQLTALLDAGQEIRSATARLAARLNLTEVQDDLIAALWDTTRSGRERAGAMLALASFRPDDLPELVARALRDDEARVRAAARIVLAQTAPTRAVDPLWSAIKSGTPLERQSAVYMLSQIGDASADRAILTILKALQQNEVPPYVRLDIYEAARLRAAHNEKIAQWLDDYELAWGDDPVAPYRDALVGGDAERGKRLFFQRVALQCSRCHKVDGQGGTIGPELDLIAAKRSREYLLDSIVVPNRDIAEGFESANVLTHDGRVVVGVLRKKTDEAVYLTTAEGEDVTIRADDIDEMEKAQSVMPENLVTQLSRMDLRDLLEYLSTLK